MQNFFQNNLKHLRNLKAVNQSEIALQVNKAHTSIGNWEKGISEPSLSDIVILSQYFGISVDDLTKTDLSNVHLNQKTGVFEMGKNVHLNVHPSVHLKDVSTSDSKVKEPAAIYGINRMPAVVTVDTQGNENVVFVPVKARAGYLNGYGDQEFIQSLPAYRMPGLNNGTFRLFEVQGNSMYNTLHSGDIVIGSFVESLAAVRDDRVYTVVSKNEGIVVKRLLNRLEKDGKLILKSDNYKDRDMYPTSVIDADDVLEIWYVTGYISRQLRPPAEMYTRMVDVEGRLTLIEEKLKEKPKK